MHSFESQQALDDAAEVLAGWTQVKMLETMEETAGQLSRADVEVVFNTCIGALWNGETTLHAAVFVLTF